MDQQRSRTSGSLAVALLLIVSVSGCGYPEVSPKTYELSKALYSICNLKREAGLPKVIELIESSLALQEITEVESRWLSEIVKLAEDGEWESATLQSRQILEAQIGHSGGNTHSH